MQLSPRIDLQQALKDIAIARPIETLYSSADRDAESSDDEYRDNRTLAEGENPIFFGESSSFKLLQYTLDSRNAADGSYSRDIRQDFAFNKRPEYWELQWVSCPFAV